jgi:berberine-like enzyme
MIDELRTHFRGALKAAWDPDSVFRMNANITPSVEVVR